jgi:hypothetical protein
VRPKGRIAFHLVLYLLLLFTIAFSANTYGSPIAAWILHLYKARQLSLVWSPNVLGGVGYALFAKEGIPQGWSQASDGGVAGTTGESRKTDAFSIRGLSFPVEYRICVEQSGWLPWTLAADNVYNSGFGKRLEAIQFRFPQGIPSDTKILARVHLQYIGWTPIVTVADGTILGTTGMSRQLEAIQIVEGSGPNADENHLRQLLADRLEAYQKSALITPTEKETHLTSLLLPATDTFSEVQARIRAEESSGMAFVSLIPIFSDNKWGNVVKFRLEVNSLPPVTFAKVDQQALQALIKDLIHEGQTIISSGPAYESDKLVTFVAYRRAQ